MKWLALLALAGCQTVVEEVGSRSPCDPLDPSMCLLPFPSDHFVVADESTATGVQVAIEEAAAPVNRDGVKTLPRAWNTRDGWSISSPMMVFFHDVTLDGTTSVTDIGAYTDADALTVIVDTVTGERVPHWVELDDTAPDVPERLLLLRPAVPLEWGRRYVVGMRGLVDSGGQPVDASPAFVALREGEASDIPDVAYRRDHFDSSIFPVLESAGVARDELQLAWDLTTASRENTIGKLLHVRDDLLARIGDDGPTLVVETLEDGDCAAGEIGRKIEGYFMAPLYTDIDSPGARLNVGEDGMPYAEGETKVDIVIRVPCSVTEDPVAGVTPLLQYGHGLLGDHEEVNTGWLSAFIEDSRYITFAVGWTGFKEQDAGYLPLMIALDPSDFNVVAERSHQGMAEFLAAMRMMAGSAATHEALTFDGVAVVDPSSRFYYGNSQGAIMGAAYLALSTDISRGVLGVGGGPYSLLLPRSHDFDPFFKIFQQKYTDHRDIMLFVGGLAQQLWDPIEGGGWVWDMVRDAEEPKQVLMQVAIYDNQVTTLGAHIQARAYGAKTIAPETRAIWGIDEVTATDASPWEGSAIVEWRYLDLPDEPAETIPPGSAPPAGYEDRDLDPHECPRREPAAQEQVRRFLEDGVVVQTCDGACQGLKEETCP